MRRIAPREEWHQAPEPARNCQAEQQPAETQLIVDAQLSMSQQCTLITNKTKCTVSNTNWLKVASRWKEYFIPLCSAPVRPYLDHSTLLAQPVQKGCWETGTHPPESQLSRERDLQGELRKLDLFSLAQRSLVWSKCSLWLLEEAYRDAGAEVFLVMSDNAMGQCLKSDALRLRLEPQS